ncbi:disease resistance protein RPM1-like [Corylus avellana]|uniref:disease resistance protein RPM1-like n=1 Tax=Corylus avellana TaxID=13451 RepID=UPI00286A00AC|nr:disease resistance protein RPM1-like [Corylus avellana]
MVEIERGSLPVLEQPEIGPCPQMKEVPSGIQHLKSLKIVDFYEMQREFVLHFQPNRGKDYWKVKKVKIREGTMTETVVILVIDKLVQLIVHESKLLKGVHQEVVDIRDELESIQCFLKDANKGNLQDGVKMWVKQVREAAYHIEDVIDEYVLQVAQHRHQQSLIGFLHKIGHILTKLKPRHDIATKIHDIKISVREIKERSERYGFRFIEQGSCSSESNVTWHDPRVGSLFIEEDEVVGIEATRDELVSWLVGEASKRSVMSVVGMGGIGKTTLAKKVYENEFVKGHFNCHVWITVSQSYNIQKILMSMIKQVYHENEMTPWKIDMIDEITLISQLRKYLQQKRYVVIFDDVWKTEFWEIVKHALPCNDRGSRIIITTRSDLIGVSCKESLFDQIHKLQPLSQDKAWELFCRKAFQSELQRCCPKELVKLSMDIFKKCEGLPLAIVAIGGLLSTKEKVPLEWKKLHDSLSSELECNPHLTSVTKILSLSYHDLPCYLKSCYLYFGIFPEDYSITGARLRQLWAAEGFIKGKKGKSLEDVAEEYLKELIHRNLVQVSFGELDNEMHRKYIIHDLLRETILSKAGELNLSQVLEAGDTTSHGISRCLSIHDAREDVFERSEYSRVRSVFLFNINEMPNSFIVKLFKKFKLLKVLDFEDAPIDYLPQEVGSLFHLKYLSLRRTKVKILPKSVGMLYNLLTLNVMETAVRELPIEIFRLYKLRQILAHSHDLEIERSFYSVRGVKVPERLRCLKDLEALLIIEVNHHGVVLFEELNKLSQLRTLGISNMTAEFGRALCTSIQNMVHLRYLLVFSINEDEIIDLQSISSPPPFLEHISLWGRLKKLPNWIPELQNLLTLVLYFSSLEEDPLPCVQALPNLINLTLSHVYDGEQLHFDEGGFRKLKKLTLRELKTLKMVEIDRGSLPNLEQLEIGPCPQMKELPIGIQHLKSLKILDFYEMHEEFVLRMQPDGGEDYWKVKKDTRKYATKKDTFIELKDRILAKVSSWKARLLSQEAKTTLVNSVANVIPSYITPLFLLPKSLCSTLDICTTLPPRSGSFKGNFDVAVKGNWAVVAAMIMDCSGNIVLAATQKLHSSDVLLGGAAVALLATHLASTSGFRCFDLERDVLLVILAVNQPHLFSSW